MTEIFDDTLDQKTTMTILRNLYAELIAVTFQVETLQKRTQDLLEANNALIEREREAKARVIQLESINANLELIYSTHMQNMPTPTILPELAEENASHIKASHDTAKAANDTVHTEDAAHIYIMPMSVIMKMIEPTESSK